VDARSVCEQLGVPHRAVDESANFQQLVVQYFAGEYKSGRTPNPCAICNKQIKFGLLLQRARQLGADYLATGHYARLEKEPGSGRILLKRGHDLRRDQSYFLFSLSQEQLSHCLFPLGEMTKEATRSLARQHGLKTAEKQKSVEICFIPDNDYRRFLEQSGLVARRRGDIVNQQGQVLGQHDGVEFYTIGQRRGLRISSLQPLYVLALDAERNQVVVGDAPALSKDLFTVERVNWIAFADPPPSFEAVVKIRYNHPGAAATVVLDQPRAATVKLNTPQRAITPGQVCVFYRDDLVLGGGWIAG
jgi:tRNA-specific 2-thiouridylase